MQWSPGVSTGIVCWLSRLCLRSSWLSLLVDQTLTRDQTRMMTTSAAIYSGDGAAAGSAIELDIMWLCSATLADKDMVVGRIQPVNTHSHLEDLPCTQDSDMSCTGLYRDFLVSVFSNCDKDRLYGVMCNALELCLYIILFTRLCFCSAEVFWDVRYVVI